MFLLYSKGLLGRSLAILFAGLSFHLHAGGSGLNTIVVVNQASPNSVDLGNYFAERRQVPPENVVRIDWRGANTWWSSNDFAQVLLGPVLHAISERGLAEQAEYVVLSMDIPFQTGSTLALNSTTAALFYGLKNQTGSDWLFLTNSYAASESPFRFAKPATAPGWSFLTTMLTAGSLAQARKLVDAGVDSDGTFPSAPVWLARTSDRLRTIRYTRFDDVIIDCRLAGTVTALATNRDSVLGVTNLLGLQTGLMNLSLSPGTFVPGSMADSLTSYGGVIFGYNDQTTLLAFIHAGAAGSYGTVTEPSPTLEKFPDPANYFYQARGFTLAESYYQSLRVPFQGLVVGEPLAAPYRVAASGLWLNASNTLLAGVANLGMLFTAADPDHPLQQVDLFIDGKLYQTLTNISSPAGERLQLSLNGTRIEYTTPLNGTCSSIARELAARINASMSNAPAPVLATPKGDRIALKLTTVSRPAPPGGIRPTTSGATPVGPAMPLLAASSGVNGAGAITRLRAARETFLDSPVTGLRTFTLGGPIQGNTFLQLLVTRSDGVQVSLAVTNYAFDGTPLKMATELAALVNSDPRLQDSNGITADQPGVGWTGAIQFTIRSRTPGMRTAGTKLQLRGSDYLVITPSGQTDLRENLLDLQPRNHLFVAAGVKQMLVNFKLDTAQLTDGYHELTAVAYEGTHVRTQTRIDLPVRVQNTALEAMIQGGPASGTGSVAASYDFEVTANSASVSRVDLYSTGGKLGGSTAMPARFTIQGAHLGQGTHPVYAVVETANGARFRTEKLWLRLAN